MGHSDITSSICSSRNVVISCMTRIKMITEMQNRCGILLLKLELAWRWPLSISSLLRQYDFHYPEGWGWWRVRSGKYTDSTSLVVDFARKEAEASYGEISVFIVRKLNQSRTIASGPLSPSSARYTTMCHQSLVRGWIYYEFTRRRNGLTWGFRVLRI